MKRKNIMFLSIVFVVAVVVSGGILWWKDKEQIKETAPLFPIAPEIPQQEKEKIPVEYTPVSGDPIKPSNTTGWKTYRNEEYKFEIKYPEGAGLEISYDNGKGGYQNDCLNMLKRTDKCPYPSIQIKRDDGTVNVTVFSKDYYLWDSSEPFSLTNTEVNKNGYRYKQSSFYMGPDMVDICVYGSQFELKKNKKSFVNISYSIELNENKEKPNSFCKQIKSGISPIFESIVQSFRNID